MIRILFGMIIGVLLLPLAVYVWFYIGRVPVAVSDTPFPNERLITSIPLQERVRREAIGSAPIKPEENNFVAGARIYTERCSVCHGLHDRPSAIGADMYPGAPQLLEQHGSKGVVGVSDDPVGETHWKVYNGIRLTGMPGFKNQLSETEMWQVSQFLSYADKPMPPAALQILHNAPAPPAAKPLPSAARKPYIVPEPRQEEPESSESEAGAQ